MGTVGLMREEERKEMTGLSRVQWWRLEREGWYRVEYRWGKTR